MPKATYDAIATTTASGSVSQIDFTGISGSYTDLILVMDYSYSTVPTTRYTLIRVGNGSIDTGSNYSYTTLSGSGSSASSGRVSNNTYLDLGNATSATGQRSTTILHFQNYSNTTTNKTILARQNNSAIYTQAAVGLWRSTSAINQIRIYDTASANFSSDSVFTLYGIKAE